ncbi:MAG: glycosyltransferase [Candidatus Woesearchaeota archaeon]|jgi:glycosyltransferase involved in cell wall biosynthesis
MNIAIFTDCFIPLVDGVVIATLNLAKGLADRGHTVHIIAPEYSNIKEFSYPHIKVKRVYAIPAFFYKGYKFTSPLSIEIIKYLKKENIDVIQFQTPITLGVQALLTARFLKKPVVGTFHTFFTDPNYIKHVGFSPPFVQKFTWEYAKKYYNQCDCITCPSESAKQELLNHGFKKPIIVVSNGIDPSVFNNSNWKNVKKEFNPHGPLLLFIGRIAYEKNINYLLQCFQFIIKKDPTVVLVIVGDGPQMEQLKKDILTLNLSKNIILTGKIDHNSLVKSGIFKACDVFVTASTTETQGITTLEAQANGLVCVGVNARGTKDLIKNNYNGYLVKEGDKKAFAQKVLNLLNDKKLYTYMSKNTLKEIQKHKITHIIDLWETIYTLLKTKQK